MRITDFESWGWAQSIPVQAQRLEEALDPARMVAWYNRQTREIQNLLKTESGPGGNAESATKLSTILNTWLDPKFRITASLNVECFDALSAVCKQYAEADQKWKYHNYFSHLYDALAQGVAALEANGMVGNGQPDEAPDMHGGAPSTSFGPTEEAPPGAAAPGEEEPAPPGGPEEGPPEGESKPANPDNPEEEEVNRPGGPPRPRI